LKDLRFTRSVPSSAGADGARAQHRDSGAKSWLPIGSTYRSMSSRRASAMLSAKLCVRKRNGLTNVRIFLTAFAKFTEAKLRREAE